MKTQTEIWKRFEALDTADLAIIQGGSENIARFAAAFENEQVVSYARWFLRSWRGSGSSSRF